VATIYPIRDGSSDIPGFVTPATEAKAICAELNAKRVRAKWTAPAHSYVAASSAAYPDLEPLPEDYVEETLAYWATVDAWLANRAR
jgi:hypothetical protein